MAMSTARWETLMARDGHQFAAYLASPAKPARGAVVVLQEIFGVNAHIRSVAEQYAAAGFHVGSDSGAGSIVTYAPPGASTTSTTLITIPNQTVIG